MAKVWGRREFIGGMAAAAGALCLPACDESKGAGGLDGHSPASDSRRARDAAMADQRSLGDQLYAPDADRLPDLPLTCGELTESNIEGPFFTPDSPQRSSLREAGMAGVPLVIEGRVLGPDCRPHGGAVLDFWQANAHGAYDNAGYTLRGHQTAGQDGSYRLETIIPGHYLNGAQYRPAHIHVKAVAKGGALLTTQLYFAGDPYNAIDPWILPSLTMALQDLQGGEKLARFDFVLAPSQGI